MAAIIEEIKTCSLFLLGGGGLFYDYYGVEGDTLLTRQHGGIPLYSGLAVMARLLGKAVMLYGVGVGPLFSDEAKRLTRIAFDCADIITVRDNGSKALLISLGIAGERITVTSDPAYLFPAEGNGDDLLAKYKLTDTHPLVGVALREWKPGKHPVEWKQVVIEALDGFMERYAAGVLLLPLHVTTPESSDRQFMQDLTKEMRHKKDVVLLPEKASTQEKAALIGKCDLLLGMRLHALIFAIQQAVPLAALEYDPKVQYALEDSGLGGYGLPLEGLSASKLESLLEEVFTKRMEIKQELAKESQRLIGLARINTKLALDLLEHPEQNKREESGQDWLNDLTLQLIQKNDGLYTQVETLNKKIQGSYERFQKDVDHFNGLLEKQLAEINADKDVIYALKAAVTQKEFDYGVLQKEFKAVESASAQKTIEIEKLKGDNSKLQEQIERQQDQLKQIKAALEQAQKEREQLTGVIETLKSDLDWYRQEVEKREFRHKESFPLKMIDRFYRGLVYWERFGFKALMQKIIEKITRKPGRRG
jgi:polysaccharide pyruvyl transferase CsaB